MDAFNGLPLHPLVVHFVVVLLPLAAVLAILGAVLPAVQRRLGIITPILSVFATALIPVATSAGESLAGDGPLTPILEKHANLGDQLIYWAVPLCVISIAWWAFNSPATEEWVHARLSRDNGRLEAATRLLLRIALLAVAIGTAIWVYRIGDAGAQSVWSRG